MIGTGGRSLAHVAISHRGRLVDKMFGQMHFAVAGDPYRFTTNMQQQRRPPGFAEENMQWPRL